MLVSGVWRLWLTPRRKSSLAASSSRSWVFWASTRANSWAFRIATAISLANSSSRSWSARSQRARRRQVADEHAELLLAGPEDGPDRQRLARDPLLDRDRRRDRRGGSRQSIIPNADSASVAARPASELERRPAARLARSPARIRPSSRLRRSRSRRGGCGCRPGGPARRRRAPRSASRGRPPRRGRRRAAIARSGAVRSAARR